jgi:hypothetical protein
MEGETRTGGAGKIRAPAAHDGDAILEPSNVTRQVLPLQFKYVML